MVVWGDKSYKLYADYVQKDAEATLVVWGDKSYKLYADYVQKDAEATLVVWGDKSYKLYADAEKKARPYVQRQKSQKMEHTIVLYDVLRQQQFVQEVCNMYGKGKKWILQAPPPFLTDILVLLAQVNLP